MNLREIVEEIEARLAEVESGEIPTRVTSAGGNIRIGRTADDEAYIITSAPTRQWRTLTQEIREILDST